MCIINRLREIERESADMYQWLKDRAKKKLSDKDCTLYSF
jgi:hypothetical protein